MASISSFGSTPQIQFKSNTNGVARPAAETTVTSAPGDGVTLSSSNASATSAAPAPAAAPANSAPPAAPTPKEWTVMVWLASDTNLYDYQINNLTDAEKVGSSDQMNIVSQASLAPSGGGCVRQLITKQPDSTTHSPILQDLGSRNMGDPKELADFIKWSKANYPAKHYMLVLNDHGSGWQGCCQDESHDGWLSLPMLEDGLKQGREGSDGKPLDIVGFDACLMANVETVSQLRDEAKFLVGSEETEGGPGWGYNQILTPDTLGAATMALRARGELTPESMAQKIVAMAKGASGDLPTMSAIDTSKAGPLLDATKAFGQALIDTKVSNSDITKAANATQGFAMEKDLWDFANRVGKVAGSDQKLADAATAVKTGIENALVAEEHSTRYPNAHGLTIELTKQRGDVSAAPLNSDPGLTRISFDKYSNLRFSKETGFDNAVRKFRAPAVAVADPTPAAAPETAGVAG